MKNFVLSILAVLYMFSTTGATLQMHYCMGTLADWSIGHDNSETCGRCGMEKTDEQANGCCNDEETFIKNTADQKPGNLVVTSAPLFTHTQSLVVANHLTGYRFQETSEPMGNIPARSSITPRHILISVFRI
jgi:hypothetical protein